MQKERDAHPEIASKRVAGAKSRRSHILQEQPALVHRGSGLQAISASAGCCRHSLSHLTYHSRHERVPQGTVYFSYYLFY